jgi:hypothetical protein
LRYHQRDGIIPHYALSLSPLRGKKQGHSEFPDVEGVRELAVEEVTGGAVTNQGSESGN